MYITVATVFTLLWICRTSAQVANFQTLFWDFIRLFVICRLFCNFLYMLKSKTFLHIPSRNHQQAPWLNIAKDFCDCRQKREKRPHPPSWLLLRLGGPAATRTLNTPQSFKTFLKHNVGNPSSVYSHILIKNLGLCLFWNCHIMLSKNNEYSYRTNLRHQTCSNIKNYKTV